MSDYKVVVKEVTNVIWRDVEKAGTGVYLIQALQRRR